jgi:hypothetical protein
MHHSMFPTEVLPKQHVRHMCYSVEFTSQHAGMSPPAASGCGMLAWTGVLPSCRPPSNTHTPTAMSDRVCLLGLSAAVSPQHPTPCPCSQQIRFGLQTPQEMIKTGVLHVYERALYKVGATAEGLPHSTRTCPTAQGHALQHKILPHSTRACPTAPSHCSWLLRAPSPLVPQLPLTPPHASAPHGLGHEHIGYKGSSGR